MAGPTPPSLREGEVAAEIDGLAELKMFRSLN
jgi:hypothetical protein